MHGGLPDCSVKSLGGPVLTAEGAKAIVGSAPAYHNIAWDCYITAYEVQFGSVKQPWDSHFKHPPVVQQAMG
jgi:hypothetical protein